jgi:hypothetical protein
MNRLLVLLLLLMPVLAVAEQQVLEVITLGYRQADDVIPIVRPLLAPGGTVTGMNNRLVVRTTPANMAELKQVLAAIDSAPRRLQISVRQTATAEGTRDSASVSGTAAIGGNAQVTVPRPPGARNAPGVSVQSGRVDVEGHAVSSRAARDEGVTQTVQVLEGNAAFIRTGQSVPSTITQITQTPGSNQVMQSTQYIDADTGFYATPRVNGDRVTLEITTARDRVRNPATGAVNIQRVGTVVSGRLGEWIEIGGSTERIDRSQSEILARSRDARSESRRVLLMVEEVK